MIGLKKLTIVMATLAALTLGVGSAFALNLVTNGDFELGNTGFSSTYIYHALASTDPDSGYGSPLGLYEEGYYGVGKSPSLYHISWANFGDHTSGTGNMMIVNGATAAANVNVWKMPVSGTIAVTQNTTYSFSAWLASSYPDNKSDLAFSINGILIGDIQLTAAPGIWQQFSVSWNSGSNTTALLSLVDKSQVTSGNDFVIDDIVFAQVPEPATMLLLGLGLVGLARVSRKFRK